MLTASAASAVARLLRPVGGVRRYSFGIPGLENVDASRDVDHTPLFCKETLQFLSPAPGKTFLDMTFGSGGHTSRLLDACGDCVVVAADADAASHEAALEMAGRYPSGALVPLRSRFSKILPELKALGLEPGSLDGVIIDSGCSQLQWRDRERGFCHTKKGWLDLRIDPDVAQDTPTASKVLQRAEERKLWKILRRYSGSGMVEECKFVTNAVVEARFMFHQFQTTQELYDVLRTAARSMAASKGIRDVDALALRMMQDTVTALRIFVNDEINELQFAISAVAQNMLRPGGKLLAVLHTKPEWKVAETSLSGPRLREDAKEERERLWRPLLGGEEPLPISAADRALHPRFPSAKLYAFERTAVRDRLVH